jgi:hypothetical protein
MKLRIAGIALLALGAASVGESQTLVSANVPFSFHACGTSFAAGAYRFSRPAAGVPAWLIRSKDANTAPCLLLSRNAGVAEHEPVSKLVFHRYGNTYFLAQVWTSLESTVSEFPPSKREREIVAGADAPKVASIEVLPGDPPGRGGR